jgi:hypothetical protein
MADPCFPYPTSNIREDSFFDNNANINSSPTLRKNWFSCNPNDWDEYVANIGIEFVLCSEEVWGKFLDKAGYGEIPQNLSPTNRLQNAIHPLFVPNRFSLENFTSESGKRLRTNPDHALHLASRMLISAAVMVFLRKVKFSREVTDPTTNRTCLT